MTTTEIPISIPESEILEELRVFVHALLIPQTPSGAYVETLAEDLDGWKIMLPWDKEIAETRNETALAVLEFLDDLQHGMKFEID